MSDSRVCVLGLGSELLKGAPVGVTKGSVSGVLEGFHGFSFSGFEGMAALGS